MGAASTARVVLGGWRANWLRAQQVLLHRLLELEQRQTRFSLLLLEVQQRIHLPLWRQTTRLPWGTTRSNLEGRYAATWIGHER